MLQAAAGPAVTPQELLYLASMVVAAVMAVRISRREGWDSQAVVPGVLVAAAAALLGARVHGWLIHRGLSFFGGLTLGSLAILGYLRWRRLPVGRACDALVPIAPVLYALFRLGCFLSGDDYGRPTSLPWGMSFPHGNPPTLARVHPTQLYEILLMFPIYAWVRTRRGAGPPGALAFELAMLMGAERFLVEFWREGDRIAAGLTGSQWLALLLFGIGLAGRVAAGRMVKKQF